MDLLEQSGHVRWAMQDLQRVKRLGIETIRTAARWHLIEAHPSEYNFASLDLILDAARDAGVEVLLDLLHFGWPDHLDIYSPTFPEHFGKFVRMLAQHVKRRGSDVRFFAPVNEISFLSWIAGDVANVFPHSQGRGSELKAALVRAGAAASEILLNEIANARLLWPEPVIHIVGDPAKEGDELEAERHTRSQFEAWDLISGRSHPELGGRPEYLDIVGVNFYDRNQWVHNAELLQPGHPRFRRFQDMLQEVWQRYGRPMFISETGAEDERRAEWFDYVTAEVDAAQRSGVPVEGICWYPILNYPGWDDGRHCCCGVFDYPDEQGSRERYEPLAEAMENFTRSHVSGRVHANRQNDFGEHGSDLFFAPPMGIRTAKATASDEPLRAARPGVLF